MSEADFLIKETDPKKICQYFIGLGVSTVVIKAGTNGAYFATDKEFQHVPGFKVGQVLDPVGAGDGFAAGLISGLIDELPLKEAVKRGNAIGALVIMNNGDVEGLPEREELEKFLLNEQEDVIR